MISASQNSSAFCREDFALIEPLEARIAPAVFTVTSLLDDVGTDGTLRHEISAANLHPGLDTIVFDLPTFALSGRTLIDVHGTIAITDALNIIGPGANKLVLDGGKFDRIFNINDGDNTTDSPVSIFGVDFTHGAGGSSAGGAILSLESLKLNHVILADNTASGGAGIFAVPASSGATFVSIKNSLITGNVATHSGGGFSIAAKSVSVAHCQILDNSAGTYGGAAYVELDLDGTAATISSTLVSGNTAVHGGGLFLKNYGGAPTAKLTISSSVISGNAASANGGGIYNMDGAFLLKNTTVENNTATKRGGGISSTGVALLSIVGGKIEGNRTTDAAGTGGALCLDTAPNTVKISGATLSDNSAYRGGAIFAENGANVTISSSRLDGNSASFGGGIWADGSGLNAVTLILNGGEVSDNTASKQGGGFDTDDEGPVVITKTKITGNVAPIGGGAYFNTNGGVALFHITVANNNATSAPAGHDNGGGGLYIKSLIGGELTISGGSFTGNQSNNDGGALFLDGSLTGTISHARITGNVASISGGGIYSNSLVTLDSSSFVSGNIASSGPDAVGI